MRAITISVLLAGLLIASGCEPAPDQQTSEGIPAESPEATIPSLPDPGAPGAGATEALELTASGELAEIDMDLSMLRLVLDDGTMSTFQYTELTEITGTNGAQGLAAREGSRAIVRYDNTTTPPTALFIDIEEETVAEPEPGL